MLRFSSVCVPPTHGAVKSSVSHLLQTRVVKSGFREGHPSSMPSPLSGLPIEAQASLATDACARVR